VQVTALLTFPDYKHSQNQSLATLLLNWGKNHEEARFGHRCRYPWHCQRFGR
jgi:hypothetical protein